MITIGDKKRDIIVVIMALLWAFVLYAAWSGAVNKNSGLILCGFFASALIVGAFYLLGAVTNEKMPVSILVYPVIFNVVCWVIAFVMAYQTRGQKLDFILGMDPGMFGAIVFFWIGSMVAAAIGLLVWFDKYILPPDKWAEFENEVSQQEKLH